jgi:sugar (pentulose or hexulose) kinase
MATLLLGVDVGTSVIKSILFDLEGNERAVASRENILLHPGPAWVEQDMAAVWQAVVDTVREAVAAAGCPPEEIAAIGVTGQGDGTWLVDATGRPVRNAIIWMDGRTGAMVRDAHDRGLSEALFAITGTALNTSNQALHLRWLEANEPAALANAHAALRAKDWVFLNLTGVVSTDESDASHTYFSPDRRGYDDRVLELLGIAHLRHLLPDARSATANLAPLRAEIARALSLAPETPVIAGPFDVAAADLGAGVLRPGDACTILGTAGIHQLVIEEPVAEPLNIGYTMCHAPAGRLVRLLPTMTGTLNMQWFVREFYAAEWRAAEEAGRDFWQEREIEAAAIPLGSQGVMYHPFIDPAGERSPFVRPDARAQFSGVSVNHTRSTLLRAVYEGVVLSAMDCYEHLGLAVRSLTLAGGGARSSFWAQMFADALGCEVVVAEGSEYGARGAAMNAGVAVGLYRHYDEAVARCVRPARTYTPHLERTADYRSLLDLYRQTYEALFPVWEARNAWRQERGL